MFGLLLALALLWAFLPAGAAVAPIACCLCLAGGFTALQIVIEGQSYPYFESVLEEESEAYFLQQVRNGEPLYTGGGAKWRERMDQVATEHKLSPRQREVMRLLLKGRDVKYIMNTFYISQATAKTHIYNLYRKLEVHSRRELLDLIEQEHKLRIG
jgi:DNA-binding NarL/FixJ family response regulator